jgi:hypothetical protein
MYISGEKVMCKWVHCPHGMARPQVADGGDGHQVWKVDANILNMQSRTAGKGWSSILGVWRGGNNSSPENISLLRNVTKDLGLERILSINDLS